MNKYIEEFLKATIDSTRKVFVLADEIINEVSEHFKDTKFDVSFDPATRTYLVITESSRYNVMMDLDDMTVKISAFDNTGSINVARCQIGINGSFEVRYGKRSVARNDALELFTKIESIEFNDNIGDVPTNNDQSIDAEVISE